LTGERRQSEFEPTLAVVRQSSLDGQERVLLAVRFRHSCLRPRALAEKHEEYARRREHDARVLSDEPQRAAGTRLGLPAPMDDFGTADRDRKRMVRLLLEDVTLNRDEQIILHIP
jgi:hypothetical protein